MTDKTPIELTPDNVARMVTLVYGKMVDSNPFWCFVTVKPSQMKAFAQRVKDKKLDLRTYVDDGFGEIVVSGEGVLPPRDVIKTVAAMFNVPIRQLFADVNFDDVINKEIERLKKELEAD
jgi:hypothetical protein